MNPTPLSTAQGCIGASLVASLCGEMHQLRWRAAQVVQQQHGTQDPRLFERLRQELAQLGARRLELQRVVAWLGRQGRVGDRLALAFLAELTNRPLVAAAHA